MIVVTSSSANKVKFKYPVSTGFMIGGLIISGVFLVLALVFSIISWPPYADFLLNRKAISGTAQIVEEPHTISYEKYTGNPNRVSFKIELSDRTKNDSLKMTARPNASYVLGANVPVEYLKNDPAIIRVKGDHYGIFKHQVILIMLCGFLVGITMFAIAKIKLKQANKV